VPANANAALHCINALDRDVVVLERPNMRSARYMSIHLQTR
jgi:hypothetical protein